jgi:hypothetical protein
MVALGRDRGLKHNRAISPAPAALLAADWDRHRRGPRISTNPDPHCDPHLAEHLLHRRTHVAGHDAGNLVIDKEAGNARVVLAFAGGVVGLAPADLEFLPAADSRFADIGDRDSVGTTPTLADLAICGYGQTNDHSKNSWATSAARV